MRRLPLPGWLLALSTVLFAAAWVSAPARTFSSTAVPSHFPPTSRPPPGRSIAEPLTPEVAPPPPPPRRSGGTGSYHSPDAMFHTGRKLMVAFTFDDGPHRYRTADLLEILRRHEVQAAFFVNGYWMEGQSERARGNRAVLQLARQQGHLVGNHTYSHKNLTHLSPAEQTEEIMRNHRFIEAVIGEAPFLFRPPYGAMTREAGEVLRRHDYIEVMWNATAPDEEIHDPEELARQVLFWLKAHRGGIVMLHDRLHHSVQAVELILAALSRENCRRARRGKPTFQVVPLDYLLGPAATSWARIEQIEARRGRHHARLKALCGVPPTE